MGAYGYPGLPGRNGTRGRDGAPGWPGAQPTIHISFLRGERGDDGLK